MMGDDSVGALREVRVAINYPVCGVEYVDLQAGCYA